jgi:hypothetical protein
LPDPPFAIVERLPAFDRDMKALKKKYRSLDEDLDTAVRTALDAYHHLGIDSGHIEPIEGIQSVEHIVVCKVVRMACKSSKAPANNGSSRTYQASRVCGRAPRLVSEGSQPEYAPAQRPRRSVSELAGITFSRRETA